MKWLIYQWGQSLNLTLKVIVNILLLRILQYRLNFTIQFKGKRSYSNPTFGGTGLPGSKLMSLASSGYQPSLYAPFSQHCFCLYMALSLLKSPFAFGFLSICPSWNKGTSQRRVHSATVWIHLHLRPSEKTWPYKIICWGLSGNRFEGRQSFNQIYKSYRYELGRFLF